MTIEMKREKERRVRASNASVFLKKMDGERNGSVRLDPAP